MTTELVARQYVTLNDRLAGRCLYCDLPLVRTRRWQNFCGDPCWDAHMARVGSKITLLTGGRNLAAGEYLTLAEAMGRDGNA